MAACWWPTFPTATRQRTGTPSAARYSWSRRTPEHDWADGHRFTEHVCPFCWLYSRSVPLGEYGTLVKQQTRRPERGAPASTKNESAIHVSSDEERRAARGDLTVGHPSV